MSAGPIQVFNVAIASGTSTSSMLDLSNKSYTKMSVLVASLTTNAQVTVYGATNSSATAFPIQRLVTTTATVAYQTQQISTSTSGSWVVFEPVPFEYVQFVASATVGGGASFTVALSD